MTRLSPRGGGAETPDLEPHGEDNRRGQEQDSHPTRLVTPEGSADNETIKKEVGSTKYDNFVQLDYSQCSSTRLYICHAYG